MTKYVIKRILLALLTAYIIITLTFILLKTLPDNGVPGTGDQVYSYFMHEVSLGYVSVFTEEQPGLELLKKLSNVNGGGTYYFYKVPIATQYFRWIGNILTKWDWGDSTVIKLGIPAIQIIGDRIGITILLNVISTIIAVPLGLLLGIVAALKKNTKLDAFISTVVMILISIPSFVLITLLIITFTDISNIPWLRWFPVAWPGSSAPVSLKILGLFIPVSALSLGSIAGYCRTLRAELCEVLSSDYLLLARTKGLTKNQAILRHALRNAMVPIVPSILAEFLSIMSGSMILENLYGIPGIGNLFITALNGKDYNVLFVDMAIFTTFGLLAGVLLDLSYGFIDPRIRMGGKK